MSVALFLPGPPPKADDSIGKITAMLVEQRRAVLLGGYVAGLAVLCYLWFLGSVWRHLTTGTRDQTGLAIAACGGGLLAVTLTLLGMAMFSGVAFKAAALGDPALVRALTDAGNTAIDTAKFGLAAFLLAPCRSGAASGVLPRWLVGAGVAAAGLLIVSAVALFVDHGAFQFGGPVDLGGGIPAVLWIAALSLTIMRRSRNGGVEGKHDDDHRPDHADRQRRSHRRLGASVRPRHVGALARERGPRAQGDLAAPAAMGRAGTARAAQHARELPSLRRPRARGERRRTGQRPNRPRRHHVLLGTAGARRRLHHGDMVAAGPRVLRRTCGRPGCGFS